MGYRTLEISSSCEIHIKEGQLEVTSDAGSILIPIEDLNQIMVHGANIRLSTMDLSILSRNKVSLMTLDEKYLPTAIDLDEDWKQIGSEKLLELLCSEVKGWNNILDYGCGSGWADVLFVKNGADRKLFNILWKVIELISKREYEKN